MRSAAGPRRDHQGVKVRVPVLEEVARGEAWIAAVGEQRGETGGQLRPSCRREEARQAVEDRGQWLDGRRTTDGLGKGPLAGQPERAGGAHRVDEGSAFHCGTGLTST